MKTRKRVKLVVPPVRDSLFNFRITGYLGTCDAYYSDNPVDIVVFAKTQDEAIKKAEYVIGGDISCLNRKIYIREVAND